MGDILFTQNVSAREGNTDSCAVVFRTAGKKNDKCRTPRARSLFSRPESIGDPINNNSFEFSTKFLHLFRQSALSKSHFVKSRPDHLHIGFLLRNCHG